MPDMKQKIAEANKAAAACLTDNDPWWVDVLPAGEVVEGLEDHMILKAGRRTRRKRWSFCTRVR